MFQIRGEVQSPEKTFELTHPPFKEQFDFSIWPHLVLYQNEKRPTSQPDALLDEEFHGRAALVGFLACSNFGTEQGSCS